jgi:hypothetical protein
MAGLAVPLIGCGSQNDFLLQSPQNYTLMVTATSGAVQHSQADTNLLYKFSLRRYSENG